jgi:hypothetical protein
VVFYEIQKILKYFIILMEIYNICSGINNLYINLNNKCSDDVCSNDVLEMIEPFFNYENDFYDIEYETTQDGGAGAFGNLASRFGSKMFSGAKGIGRGIGTKEGRKGIGQFLNRQSDKASIIYNQPGRLWDKLRDMGGVDDPNTPVEGEEGKDALYGTKKFIRRVAYVCVFLIFIGGMPILPWAIIIYYTFKKLKSGYTKIVQPI